MTFTSPTQPPSQHQNNQPNQEWTIGQLLSYCEQGIKFNTKGTGKLRLVAAYRVGQEKAYAGAMTRAFRVLENEFTCETVLKFVMEGNCSVSLSYLYKK